MRGENNDSFVSLTNMNHMFCFTDDLRDNLVIEDESVTSYIKVPLKGRECIENDTVVLSYLSHSPKVQLNVHISTY